MIYTFEDMELDLDRVELRRASVPVPIEPQVFAILLLLVENHNRMVSRDEIIERVWEGRIVSDSAISSRIKAARRAVGDDGARQAVIKTVHGRGFRCIAEVRIASGEVTRPRGVVVVTDAASPASIPRAAGGPLIAVLPFHQTGETATRESLGEAIPHEIISALSRARWLKVISRGSSFRFRERDPDVREVGRALGVRYCLTGLLEVGTHSLRLSTELAETSEGGVIWSETYRSDLRDIHAIRGDITAGLVATLERQLSINESLLAQASPPANLDAWSHYHLGLERVFRFSNADNDAAAQNFAAAIAMEPEFARAHAGLSFTEFQRAYLGYAADREASAAAARRHAEHSVVLDPLDPFANFTLGRSFWLSGDIETSIGWLDRSFDLSPSYAQGIYARAWAETMLGHPQKASADLDNAMSLSPLDPFLFAMKGTRALGYLEEDRIAEAVQWIDAAARSPGANAVVNLVAAAVHEIFGSRELALGWAKRARARSPMIDSTRLFQALPFADQALRQRLAASLDRLGIG